MLSSPCFTRSLLDSLDDDISVLPLDYIIPRSIQRPDQLQLAVPSIANNKYNLNLDLRNFDPSEISVKFEENMLKVSGKREKKSEDGSHYEYREYQRQLTVPDNVIADQIKCHLTEKGVLKFEAPVQTALEDNKQRPIPIEHVKK